MYWIYNFVNSTTESDITSRERVCKRVWPTNFWSILSKRRVIISVVTLLPSSGWWLTDEIGMKILFELKKNHLILLVFFLFCGKGTNTSLCLYEGTISISIVVSKLKYPSRFCFLYVIVSKNIDFLFFPLTVCVLFYVRNLLTLLWCCSFTFL